MSGPRRQRGAIMIMMALIIIVLIGVAALALDIGRLVVLRSQMQNAADAAALAAAVELNGEDDAITRAKAAAREAIAHDSRHARVAELLGSGGLPDAAFTFYCIIGAEFDVDPDDVDLSAFCDDTTDDGDGHYETSDDHFAHYVRVDLSPTLVSTRYTLDLMFLPVLDLFGGDVATTASTSAHATAGQTIFPCDPAPMMICDPFPAAAGGFFAHMHGGETIELRSQGGPSSWAAGNFGFTDPVDGGSGAANVGEKLADEYGQDCDPAEVDPRTGQMTQRTTNAVNTRFDSYGNPGFNNAWATYPPAENILQYAHGLPDTIPAGTTDARFGVGNWNFSGYMSANHPIDTIPNTPAYPRNPTTGEPTRWAVYNWEVDNCTITPNPNPDLPPVYSPLCKIPLDDLTTPLVPLDGGRATHNPRPPDTSLTPPRHDRRLISIYVVNCEAAGVNGTQPVPIQPPGGMARVFFIRKATDPSGASIWVEFVQRANETDATARPEVQLYE